MVNPARVRVVEPVYMKNNSVSPLLLTNANYVLSTAMKRVVKDMTVCAQQINGLWYLYVKTEPARLKLLQQGLDVEGIHIVLYDSNPYGSSNGESLFSTEKIIIRDVPFTVSDTEILHYMHNQYPQVVMTSTIQLSKIRDNYDTLTDIYNGDRFFHAQADFTPALPKTCYLGDRKIKFWHRGQKNSCIRCSETGHVSSDINNCSAYIDPTSEEQKKLSIFQSASNPLSNFWEDGEGMGFEMDGIHFKTSEHGYQYHKSLRLDCGDIAQRILVAPTPAAAKREAGHIPVYKLYELDGDFKKKTMIKVLMAKADGCTEFRQRLMDTKDNIIIEAGRDGYWAAGLQYNIAISTKYDCMPGDNTLGECLTVVRKNLIDTAEANASRPPGQGHGSDTMMDGDQDDQEQSDDQGGNRSHSSGSESLPESSDSDSVNNDKPTHSPVRQATSPTTNRDNTMVVDTGGSSTSDTATDAATNTSKPTPRTDIIEHPNVSPETSAQDSTAKRDMRQARSRIPGSHGARSRSSSLIEIQDKHLQNTSLRTQTLDMFVVKQNDKKRKKHKSKQQKSPANTKSK